MDIQGKKLPDRCCKDSDTCKWWNNSGRKTKYTSLIPLAGGTKIRDWGGETAFFRTYLFSTFVYF